MEQLYRKLFVAVNDHHDKAKAKANDTSVPPQVVLSYKVQFYLHQQLVQAWKLASEAPEAWKEITRSRLSELLQILTRMSDSLSHTSATLCLGLAALALEGKDVGVGEGSVV